MATINDIMRSFNLRDMYGSLLDIMPELANMTGGLGGVSPMQTGKGVLNIDNRDVFNTTKSSMSSIGEMFDRYEAMDNALRLGQEGGRERPEQEIPKVDGSLLDIMPELANMTGGLGGVSPMQTGKGVLNIDNRDVFNTTKPSMSSIINSGVLNQGIGDLTPMQTKPLAQIPSILTGDEPIEYEGEMFDRYEAMDNALRLGQEGGRERPEQEIPKVDPSYLHNKFYDDRRASNLLDQIAEQNLKDRRFMRGVGAAKALDSASSLLHNLFEGDGLAPVESVNLVSPEVRYDDTLREKMAGEATKMADIAQMNAMKMGAGGMIPAIQSSAMRSVNEGNIQAQAQLNQIQQQNAMWGADTANKEQEFYVTQRDKIINDALRKNMIRSEMIGQSKADLWKDLERMKQQDQLYKEADFMSKMAREAASDPYGLADRYMKSLPGYDNITRVSDKDKDKE